MSLMVWHAAGRVAQVESDDVRALHGDDALVLAAQANTADFAALFERYFDPIYRFCYRRLGTRAAGGKGDTERTLDICALLAADRDDTVVKAMSWALRELVVWDPDAVRRFLSANQLAARVNREVQNKLDSGLKSPKKSGRPL